MKWPWQSTRRSSERLAFSLAGERFVWALADGAGDDDQAPRLTRWGVTTLTAGDVAARARQIKALGLPTTQTLAVLPLKAYQMLQIEAPAVPADELRAAARWRIKDLLDGHVDDVTIDVMHVGPQRSQGLDQLFVVAATNPVLAEVTALATESGLPLTVVDVLDTAQRNLHTAAAAEMDLADRATACLVLHEQQCLLTLCVGDELYYSRRLDWDPQLAARAATVRTPSADGDAFSLQQLGVAEDDHSRLVVELQRSFDVWERSWPDLPLALLLLHADQHTPAVARHLEDALGLRVLPLDLGAALSLTTDGATLDALSPIERRLLPAVLGALLRTEAVQP